MLKELSETDNLCPPVDYIFAAFSGISLENLNVVILGQDPYHTGGKASGLAFGYHPAYMGPIDSSLKNILNEVETSCGKRWTDVSLRSWRAQGVLLLNTRLTTETGKPLAHKNIGWEKEISKTLSSLQSAAPHVYMLWGKEAQSFAHLIDQTNHLVLTASHPCSYSAHKGFIGCQHFRKANEFLSKNGRKPILW